MRCSEAGAETVEDLRSAKHKTQKAKQLTIWVRLAGPALPVQIGAHRPANIPVCLCNEYLPTSKHPKPGIFNLSHLNE